MDYLDSQINFINNKFKRRTQNLTNIADQIQQQLFQVKESILEIEKERLRTVADLEAMKRAYRDEKAQVPILEISVKQISQDVVSSSQDIDSDKYPSVIASVPGLQ